MGILPKMTLGISPGTRIMGIAILKNSELIEWKIKTFKGRWSQVKQHCIITAIKKVIKQYGITEIAFKTPDPKRSSPELNRLIAAVKKLAVKNEIKVYSCSLSDLKCTYSKVTKAELWEHIALQYPELFFEYQREQMNSNSYYEKIFEAVACAKMATTGET